MGNLPRKVGRLRDCLKEMGSVLVCFSGGVDSSYLLAEAVQLLDKRAWALTALSPSLSPEEEEETRHLARRLGAQHLLVRTEELEDPRYAANPLNRCYFCKRELYGVALEKARELGLGQVVDGFNREDRGEHRPGRRAALERGIRSPLDEAGFAKRDVRAAARELGLPVWDKPALACLASRFPHGTRITESRLARVGRCEGVLRQMGFRVFRVRYHGDLARIETGRDEVARLLEPAIRQRVRQRFLEEGFRFVSVDLDGYRRGSLEESPEHQVREKPL